MSRYSQSSLTMKQLEFILVVYVASGLHADATGSSAPKNRSSDKIPVKILKQIYQYHTNGSLTFGYESGDGSFRYETRDPAGQIDGKYGYIDTDGHLRVVEYHSGTSTGYQTLWENFTQPVIDQPVVTTGPAPTQRPEVLNLSAVDHEVNLIPTAQSGPSNLLNVDSGDETTTRRPTGETDNSSEPDVEPLEGSPVNGTMLLAIVLAQNGDGIPQAFNETEHEAAAATATATNFSEDEQTEKAVSASGDQVQLPDIPRDRNETASVADEPPPLGNEGMQSPMAHHLGAHPESLPPHENVSTPWTGGTGAPLVATSVSTPDGQWSTGGNDKPINTGDYSEGDGAINVHDDDKQEVTSEFAPLVPTTGLPDVDQIAATTEEPATNFPHKISALISRWTKLPLQQIMNFFG